ncbi:uncharacterized protein LOC105686285 [Athalia rosae]|uniref:uncharacterized protein LOC105686285 n=1 Tax=Athalia rosae TaxID=37344 RepID=UPI00203376B4|nr:uncharacterized protein LOC105686285 [Athalia rosae]
MSRYWCRFSASDFRIAGAICEPRFVFAVLLICAASRSSHGNPTPLGPSELPEFNQSATTVVSLLNNANSSNSSANDLYVIRAVVYEIGILTDVDESTNQTTDRHEEVNLSFYDPPHKDDGLLDLSGIPIPQVVTAANGTL